MENLLIMDNNLEKCEPVAKLGRWMIDKSTGTDILTLDNCSVIKGQYAHYIMGLLQKEIDKVVSELENTSPISKESTDWQYFDEAYKKATESSEPDDWMNAALMAQQVRRKQLNAEKG
jgi:hypothetical protein